MIGQSDYAPENGASSDTSHRPKPNSPPVEVHMIASAISQYEILEKLGEVRLRSRKRSFVGLEKSDYAPKNGASSDKPAEAQLNIS